jgi:hypothetical protein
MEDELFILLVRFEYLLCIPSFEVGSKVVISFSKRADPFSRVCLFDFL